MKCLFLMIVVGGFQLSCGIELKCKFVVDTVVVYMEETYSCQNFKTKLENKNNNKEITGYTGKHLRGKKDIDVKMIEIQSSPLIYIPEKIGSLSSLTYFHVINCQLVEIKADNFIGMEDLEYLDLSNNELKSFKIDTFAKLSKLKEIELKQNKLIELQNGLFSNNVELTYINFNINNIEVIGNTLFDSLPKLSFVNFVQNECLNLAYEEENMIKLKKDIMDFCINTDEKYLELIDEILMLKKEIDRLNNELKKREPKENKNSIMKCTYDINDTEYVCRSRDLTINRDDMTIDEIQGAHLDSKSNTDVSELYIRKSKMLYLSKDIFKHFMELKTLKIDEVNLNQLSKGNFNGATKLMTFHLMKNDIKHLENNIFDGAEQLKIIKMDSNQIEEISKGTFNGLKLLKTLSLKENKIEELHLETFKDLVNLNNLILSRNNLKFLNGKLLEFNVNLELVLFDHNQLREIGENIFKYAGKLQNINLYENTCIGDKSNNYDINQIVFVIKHCCKNPNDTLQKYNCGQKGWEQ